MTDGTKDVTPDISERLHECRSGVDQEVGVRPLMSETSEAVKEDGLRPGDYVKITISDTGIGIENLELIFDPYFTTKRTGGEPAWACRLSMVLWKCIAERFRLKAGVAALLFSKYM